MSIAHVPKQNDAVTRKLVQIQALATVLARDLRVWMELICRRFQFFNLRIEHSNPGEPVIDILTAIPSRHAPGTADREINFPATLIQLLGNLRSRLPGSHDKHCTLRKC